VDKYGCDGHMNLAIPTLQAAMYRSDVTLVCATKCHAVANAVPPLVLLDRYPISLTGSQLTRSHVAHPHQPGSWLARDQGPVAPGAAAGLTGPVTPLSFLHLNKPGTVVQTQIPLKIQQTQIGADLCSEIRKLFFSL
jgi:hypothetical protein